MFIITSKNKKRALSKMSKFAWYFVSNSPKHDRRKWRKKTTVQRAVHQLEALTGIFTWRILPV